MPNILAGRILPSRLRTPLFGYRENCKIEFREDDPDWKIWLKIYNDFYSNTQTSGIGGRLTKLGYKALSNISMDNKVILEIGPGNLPHRELWNGKPSKYISVDVDKKFHSMAKRKCSTNFQSITRLRGENKIDVPSNSVDIVLSFYSLEHLENIEKHINEIHRILKKGGLLVGAVPNEGGLVWGLGRFLITRRWIMQRYELDYDKIIAWEHPNYVDQINKVLNKKFHLLDWSQKPFKIIKSYNLNLLSSFIFLKSD